MDTDDLENQQVESDTGVSGEEQGIDWDAFEPEQPSTEGQAEVTEGGDNPKWKPFLEAIPAPFHEQVKPLLRDWDKGVNQRFQELNEKIKAYEPYNRFQEQQVAPEVLQRSYDLSQRLATDPVSFYNDLHAALVARGQLQEAQQVQQAAEQVAQKSEDGVEDPYLEKMTELERRLEERDRALAEFVQSQEREQLEQQYLEEETAKIDEGFKNIETKIRGTLPPDIKGLIIEKAMALGQQTQRYVTVEEAAPHVFRALNAARRTAAPRTIPTGGSIPQTPVEDAGEMTKEQRFAAARAIRENILSQM